MATAGLTYYTPEEYLALERHAEFKSEYIDGRIVAMTGASATHNAIAGNIISSGCGSAAGRAARSSATSACASLKAGDTRIRI
jgi:Uma2 family endonuclease